MTVRFKGKLSGYEKSKRFTCKERARAGSNTGNKGDLDSWNIEAYIDDDSILPLFYNIAKICLEEMPDILTVNNDYRIDQLKRILKELICAEYDDDDYNRNYAISWEDKEEDKDDSKIQR